MAELLTAERVSELVGLPKRFLRPKEFAWRPLGKPGSDGPPPGDLVAVHHRIIRARLLVVDGREAFELAATANGKFSMKLQYRSTTLVRLCCAQKHKIPRKLGGGSVRGPHVHYHRPGFGTKYAVGSDAFSHHDVNEALHFFLALCAVRDVPPIQEMLELK